MELNRIIIFTDGASKGNPGPGGWGAVIILPQNNDGEFEVQELGGREGHTTNNRMELRAAIEALTYLKTSNLKLPTLIYSDSSYLINGITKWVFGWQKKNWITSQKEEVMNRDLWEKLIEIVSGKDIKWEYIGGHIGIAGNNRADIIATSFAEGASVNLYKGMLEKYPIKNILDTTYDESSKGKKKESRDRSKSKAYSYISMVDGIVQTHSTWAECEVRVKGKSGAKFKKTLSLEEEGKIIEDWKKL